MGIQSPIRRTTEPRKLTTTVRDLRERAAAGSSSDLLISSIVPDTRLP
jgi:hypothetical protein